MRLAGIFGAALSLFSSGFLLADAKVEYFAVCDAGSTGTRLYVFQVDAKAGKASSVFVKKIKPGLSSYVARPADAGPPLLKLLREGAQAVPEGERKRLGLKIFGTAGMRLLKSEEQASVWQEVEDALAGDPEYPFDVSAIEAGTVSGEEEGLWAVLTTNFLTGHMSDKLLSNGKGSPLGLMDLGGSSTQIAIPSAAAAQKGGNFHSDVLVHSYLGFGMTYIREKMRVKHHHDKGDAACYMWSASIDAVPTPLSGMGNASLCRGHIRDMLEASSHSCQGNPDESPCLGDIAFMPEKADAITKGSVEFMAVAGFTYVVDFVRWWLELNPTAAAGAKAFLNAYPRPSLAELRTAANFLCEGNYKVVAELTADDAKRHRFTQADNAPFRCFQVNYILVLLQDMYGFAEDGRSITFALDVDGEDLEWPLGALLHQRALAAARSDL
eukprot:TRINITY_DN48156_c0_g1_i1.p1 TRINITY_DN48156_c0_g1~~TRINITY_DN48156_c0_g1_i1.p1  ORF type:complete len:461 (+),score=72.97 TRINITY_DN48156_c0_g1_i1:65-1384(+)